MESPDPESPEPPYPELPRSPEAPELKAAKVYSVPRRYDLTTMFVVSTAFALLFAGMRILEWPKEAALTTGLFITLVGLGQAMLFGGKSPRLASVVVGVVFFFVYYSN
jgi:ABC-type proline/glycine betaine transport system permease subunit